MRPRSRASVFRAKQALSIERVERMEVHQTVHRTHVGDDGQGRPGYGSVVRG